MENQDQPVLGEQPAENAPSVLDAQPAPEQQTLAEPAAEQPAAPAKKKKSKAPLIIILVVLLLGAAAAAIFFIFFNKGAGDSLSFEKKTPAPEAYTAAEKMTIDYEAGAISTDEYVKQLTYTQYDKSKIDKKYKTDDGAVDGDGNADIIFKLLKTKPDEISDATKKEFAKHFYLADVAFGKEDTTTSSTDGVKLASVQKAATESYLHRLDKVVMSSSGNFLIWYTETGNDKITTEQAKRLGESLETSIKKYTELTGYNYQFTSVLNDEGNGGKTLMKKRLAAESGIPESKVTDAMSVYVMDTKSDSTLATYYSMTCDDDSTNCDAIINLAKLFNAEGLQSGAVATPYIAVNNISFNGSQDYADQVINHELFHHYQNKIICAKGDGKWSSCHDDPYYYTEATANLFSATVSSGSNESDIMNIWAGRFSTYVNGGVKNINSNGTYGYGQWPYYYSYKTKVKDGLKYIVEAHKQNDPYAYLHLKASESERRDAINDAAYIAFTKDCGEMGRLKNSVENVYENDPDENFNFGFDIAEGGIHYFQLGQNWSIDFSSSNSAISAIMLGKKDGKYKVLKTATSSLSASNSDYSGYSDFVLSVTNGNISSKGNYSLKYKQNDVPDAINLNHKYDNYAVEYEMEIVFAGLTTTATGKGRVDEKHQRSYLETEFNALGIKMNTVSYSDYYNGVDYYTNPTNALGGGLGDLFKMFSGEDTPEWVKSSSASHTIDIDLIVKKLRDSKQTTQVDGGHYKTRMTAKEMQDLMQTANKADEKNQYEFKDGTIDVDVYINGSGRIEKIEYDFSDLVSAIDKFTCTMKLSKYNYAGDVIIPETVRYGAKEQ